MQEPQVWEYQPFSLLDSTKREFLNVEPAGIVGVHSLTRTVQSDCDSYHFDTG